MNGEHSHARAAATMDPPDGSTALQNALLLASQCRVMTPIYATVAHDFRNSLNAMSLSMDLLNRTLEHAASTPTDPAVQRRYIDSVRQELRTLTQCVGNVLDDGHFEPSPSARCRLLEIMESAAALLRPRADRQGVRVSLDTASDAIEVVGRSRELRLAVLNLAVNALDAMPRGGQLVLRLTTEDGCAVISVSDTGPGIPEAIRPQVWDQFFSTKDQGPGLGLHVVRNVTHQHGGAVTLDPSDSGACFTIRLPLRT